MFLITSCDKCGECVQADIEQIVDKEVNIICKLCGEEKNKMEKENNINSELIIKQLNLSHKIFNEKLFESKLKPVIITIYSDRKNKRTLGHFTSSTIWNNKYHELVIKGLAWDSNPRTICEVLLHEMVHQYCTENKIKDVETNGRHNKEFKKAAESHGLIVNKPTSKNIGYTTDIKPESLILIEKSEVDLDIFKNFLNDYNHLKIKDSRSNLISNSSISEEEKKRAFKYTCLNCDFKFSIKLELNLKCNECNQNLLVS